MTSAHQEPPPAPAAAESADEHDRLPFGLEACLVLGQGISNAFSMGAATRLDPQNVLPKRIVISFDVGSIPGPEREGGHLGGRAAPTPFALLWGEGVGKPQCAVPEARAISRDNQSRR